MGTKDKEQKKQTGTFGAALPFLERCSVVIAAVAVESAVVHEFKVGVHRGRSRFVHEYK